MRDLAFTILVDGPSDRALVPIIEWSLARIGCLYPPTGQVVSPATLRKIARNERSLDEKISLALEYFPCDLLIIHRDAERQSHESRIDEIRRAVERLDEGTLPYTVPIVPVRMHEAWLLFSEEAIRTASGNPNGDAELELPDLKTCESLPDPKDYLDELLRKASGFSGNRLRKFDCAAARSRVVELIEDFSPLESLPAFDAFLSALKDALQYSPWM